MGCIGVHYTYYQEGERRQRVALLVSDGGPTRAAFRGVVAQRVREKARVGERDSGLERGRRGGYEWVYGEKERRSKV